MKKKERDRERKRQRQSERKRKKDIETERQRRRKRQIEKEREKRERDFKNISKCYEKYCSEELTDSVLCSLHPKELTLLIDGQALNVVHNLLKLDMKPLMDKINAYNQNNENCFGYLPLMACSSECQLAALNFQSFSEQVHSIANLVVNRLALKTDPEFVDMLVTLRANEPFMNFIKENKYKD